MSGDQGNANLMKGQADSGQPQADINPLGSRPFKRTRDGHHLRGGKRRGLGNGFGDEYAVVLVLHGFLGGCACARSCFCNWVKPRSPSLLQHAAKALLTMWDCSSPLAAALMVIALAISLSCAGEC